MDPEAGPGVPLHRYYIPPGGKFQARFVLAGYARELGEGVGIEGIEASSAVVEGLWSQAEGALPLQSTA